MPDNTLNSFLTYHVTKFPGKFFHHSSQEGYKTSHELTPGKQLLKGRPIKFLTMALVTFVTKEFITSSEANG